MLKRIQQRNKPAFLLLPNTISHCTLLSYGFSASVAGLVASQTFDIPGRFYEKRAQPPVHWYVATDSLITHEEVSP